MNDLIGSYEERLRDREPKRLGGLEVDHQLKLGGLFDRQIARLCSFQNLVHEICSAPESIGERRTVRKKATGVHGLPWSAQHCQAIFECQLAEPRAIRVEHRASDKKHRRSALSSYCCENAVQLAAPTHCVESRLNAQCSRRGLDLCRS